MKPLHTALLLVVVLIQVACLVFFGSRALSLKYDNRIDRFAVKNQAGEHSYRLFSESFGNREHLIVALGLLAPLDGESRAAAESIFAKIAADQGISAYYSAGTLPGPPAKSGAASPFPFSNDSETVYAGLFELSSGSDRDEIIQRILILCDRLQRENSRYLERLSIAGEPLVNYQLNLTSREVRDIFFPILMTLSLVFLSLCFRDLKVLLVTTFSVVSSLATTLGIMALAGQSLNLVTTLIPSLIFVLGVAMQVHLLVSIGIHGSVRQGLREKWKPNLWVSATTSIGFASLITSRVTPIADMGLFMAVGIWVVYLWTHLTHLTLSRLLRLRVYPPPIEFLRKHTERKSYWRRTGRPALLLIPVSVIFLGGFLLRINPRESNGLHYFQDSHWIRQHTAFVEENLTGASQVELLLRRPETREAGAVYLPDGRAVDQLEHRLAQIPHVRHLLSLNRLVRHIAGPTMGPDIDESEGELRFQATLRAMALLGPPALKPYISKRFYRIQMLVDSLDKEAYTALKKRIEDAVAGAEIGVPFLITGPLDRVIEIQDYLLTSLSRSLALTVIAVMLLMMICLRGGNHPLLILIPNLFPLGGMALAMWVLNIKTTISTVMVFSIAFGISVDDTIHLLHGYFQKREGDFRERWTHALRRDGRAILLATCVLIAGFLVLTVSSFIPTRHFGLLLALGMALAFLGTLWFLPLMLRRLQPPRTTTTSRESGSGHAANIAGTRP